MAVMVYLAEPWQQLAVEKIEKAWAFDTAAGISGRSSEASPQAEWQAKW
jgi:hypothetical protein